MAHERLVVGAQLDEVEHERFVLQRHLANKLLI